MRIGIGYDIHRLIPTTDISAILLGGVKIPCFFQVEAHSDGDVLLHALVDACFGALALGDIGQWFPDSNMENRRRPSADFITTAVREMARLGWRLKQCDCNVITEEPKVGPIRDEIRRNIATLFDVELSEVSVKAKTAEGLGDIGARRAIACQTVVTLVQIN